ncbi:MAG: DNA repair exonuclease [Candidatus Omnitrophica bacterium]|nr:DNA repair exonuclease [Candidatus Omnitrophota bacterium]
MKVKFLHVADFHLDSKFLPLGESQKVRTRRKELAETFKKFIQFANLLKEQEGLDFILIAGDLFEHDCYSPHTLKTLLFYGLENLKPLPVFIAAGNHDPLVSDSPYVTYDWPSNVHIFPDSFQKVEFRPDVHIYGISVTPQNLGNNVLQELKISNPEVINIVVFHGAEKSSEKELFGDCFPFSGEDMAAHPCDYFALGHYHNFRKVPLEGDNIRGYYSGSPEPLNFKELGEHYILKVEVDKNSGVKVEPISFQRRIYKQVEVDCSGISSLEDVKVLIRECKDESAVVNLVLRGEIDPDIRIDLEELAEFIREENIFFSVRIKNATHSEYTSEMINSSPLAKSFLDVVEKNKDKYPPQLLSVVVKLGLDGIFIREVRNWDEI